MEKVANMNHDLMSAEDIVRMKHEQEGIMRRITARERLTIWNSLILLIFTLALPLWAEAEILFQEDFNDGNALGWEEINGNWTVENGEYSSYLNGCNLPGNTFIGSADWRE